MDIPDFDDFLNAIDTDQLSKKYANRNQIHILHFSPQDPQAFENALSLIYQDAVQTSLNLMTEFLAVYHAWLREKL